MQVKDLCIAVGLYTNSYKSHLTSEDSNFSTADFEGLQCRVADDPAYIDCTCFKTCQLFDTLGAVLRIEEEAKKDEPNKELLRCLAFGLKCAFVDDDSDISDALDPDISDISDIF